MKIKYTNHIKRETSVKVKAKVFFDEEWVNYSFDVDYKIFNNKNRFKEHLKMWAERRIEQLKDEKNVEELKNKELDL